MRAFPRCRSSRSSGSSSSPRPRCGSRSIEGASGRKSRPPASQEPDSHEVFTASYMGFDGLKNGALLRAVEDGGFDVLVTGDQSLHYEQNLVGRRLAVVVLSAVQFAILGKHLPKIVLAIDGATPGSFQAVD